jgi:O-antigen/teichoic acid export membrane protein
VPLGVLGALLGQVAGGLFVIAVALVMLWRAGGPSLDEGLARRALAFGLPLVPHTLFGWVLNVSDRWLLGLLLPMTAVAARAEIGIYSLAYQLAYAVDLLAQSFNAAWVPFYYRHGDSPQGTVIHRETTSMVMAAFGALSALLAINAELIVTVIARPEFGPAAGIVPILAVGFLAHAFYIAIVTVLFHARQTRILPIITGLSALLNVGVNVVLIPTLGTTGAAWATLLAFVFMAAATTVAARRVRRVSVDWPRVGLMAALSVAAAAWTTTRTGSLSIERVAVDLALSLLVVAVAVVIALGPFRRLRSLTRDAVRSAAAPAAEPPAPASV